MQFTALVVLHVYVAVGIRFLDCSVRTEVDQRLLRGIVLPGIARVWLQQGELSSVAVELGMLRNQRQRTFRELRREVDILLQDQHAFIRVVGSADGRSLCVGHGKCHRSVGAGLAGLLIEDKTAGFGMHSAILRGRPACAGRRLYIEMYRPKSVRRALRGVVFELIAVNVVVARPILAVERDADFVQRCTSVALVLDHLGSMQRKERVAALGFRIGKSVGILLDVDSETGWKIAANVAEPVAREEKEAEDGRDQHPSQHQDPGA